MDGSLRVGDLARATGTRVVTIRDHENAAVLLRASLSRTHYRTCDSAALARLRFIRRCRRLGFSLDQVRDLLTLSCDAEHPCADVDALAGPLRAIAGSTGGGTISDCRIIDAIAPD
ncbi:MerR family DNA-binding protein [Acuticoccus sp. MNP-M23]|uniref:MerR family DNA-binding protein n=1 Tax=Acuticoccus sp. MNP-M23 TaxID=3072793 RepID=UPI00281525E8|nr:MerR family DNA-binding protein [Acuticoccus sp. MNP-M23]WMS41079.1 MerR family DNA-binding protein [Acuticoccus sp. MNP-M23]